MSQDKSMSSTEECFSSISLKGDSDFKTSESMTIAEMNFEVTSGQLEIGINHYNSCSDDKNCENAFEFINRSAEHGNAEAQFMLGNLYALGHGTETDHEKAYMWYTKSAIQGYKKALIRIHNLYQEDIGVHCRGQLNSEEDEWNTEEFKQANKIRELNEYRLERMKHLLNGAIDYYTNQFKILRSAKQDIPEAQQTLGFLYQHGYGVKKITRWAIECYTTAAEQGFIDAQYNLGYLYQQNTSMKFNYRKAFQWYSEAAQEGQTMAQKSLAYFYEKGLGTEINVESAIFWYLKAANAGNSEAQLTLGKFYRKGQYVEQDCIKASRWYLMAARQGNRVAQNCLVQLNQSIKNNTFICDKESKQHDFIQSSMKNNLCSKLRMDISLLSDCDKATQIQSLAMCAFKGDGSSMYKIGLKYLNGNDFHIDTQTGLKWIKNAAKAGVMGAQEMLVKMFEEGKVIEQDYHKMQIWTRFGTKKNNSKFLCNLGILYTKGQGVRCDPLEASKWFTRSATLGNSDAQYQLGLLRYSGRGLRQDLNEAFNWFQKSALQRNINAIYELGKFFFYGVNVDQRINLPLRSFQYAAASGNVSAQLHLGKVYEEGHHVGRDIDKAIKFYNMLSNSKNGYGQYVLGLKYLKGELLNQDYEKAFSLFEQASEKGYFEAKALFSIPLVQRIESLNYSLVLEMFHSAFQDGKPWIAFNIGFIYEYGLTISNGSCTIKEDYDKAITWYEIAAKNGDCRAMYRLGVIYEENDARKDLELAVSYYKNARKGRERGAIYRLACMYLDGRGVEQNFLTAYNLFTEASNMGHKESSKVSLFLDYVDSNEPTTNNYGQEDLVKINFKNQMLMFEDAAEVSYSRLAYLLGKFHERNNDTKALKWYDLAIKKGITDAYFRLGEIYENDKLVKKDYSIAISNYEKTIGKYLGRALFRLAQMYNYGIGVECDYLKAYHLYTKAANLGFNLACKLLNMLDSQKDYSTREEMSEYFKISSKELEHVIKMFTLVAGKDNGELQYRLGVFYEKNKPYSDFKKSLDWYEKASKNENRDATYRLGLLYENGELVEQNYKKSFQFYNQAKNLGSNDALFKLASAYHYGQGVEKNSEIAVDFYREAANSGQPEYQYILGKLYETGELMQNELLKAIKWYTKAYLQGHTRSIYHLYEMYDHEPYEYYFDIKLFNILKVYEISHQNEDKKDYKLYGSMYFKLAKFYEMEGNLTNSLRYFSKSYNVYGNPDAKEFATVECSGEDPDTINKYSKKMEIYQTISLYLDGIQQYKLGMVYYEGVNRESASQNTKKSPIWIILENELIDKKKKEDPINADAVNVDTVDVIKYGHKKAEYYFKQSSLSGNQKALVQLVKMHFKKETEPLKISTMSDSFKKTI